MSVINKMLTDLDQRRAASVSSPENRTLTTGTISLGGDRHHRSAKSNFRWGWLVTGLAVVGALAGSALWWFRAGPAGSAVAVVQPAPHVAAVAAPVVPPASAPAPLPSPSPDAALPLAGATAADNKSAPGPSADMPSVAAAPVPVAVRELPSPTVVAPKKASESVVLPPAAPSSAPAAAAPAAPVAGGQARPLPNATRQTAVQEALVRAQGLWQAGSQEQAVALLRSTLLSFEQSASPLNASAAPALAPLARELARMELTQGRASQAYEMLVRLEPALAGEADIWALRGNAAQRLARHTESAEAYLAALRLKPTEARWMLGAAVSLAVQGQTAEAAQWAEKARYSGGITPEVLAYLRQLGVTLADK